MQSPVTFSSMLASPAHSRRPVSNFASSAASPAGEDFDFEYEAEDDQGRPLTTDPSTSYALPDDDAESRAMAVAIGKVCWETKGEDLMVLHVAPLVYWTRYMVIATVFSRPQLNAMLAKIEKEAEETFDRRPASSAAGTSAWELLDFGDVVVHVLTADQREYYDLVRKREKKEIYTRKSNFDSTLCFLLGNLGEKKLIGFFIDLNFAGEFLWCSRGVGPSIHCRRTE